MLIRIVHMHFHERYLPDFFKIFQEHKDAIRNFEGCTHLELLKGLNSHTTFTTLSYWKNSDCLDAYRKSELFRNVWSSVKILFSEKPQAFSLQKFIEL